LDGGSVHPWILPTEVKDRFLGWEIGPFFDIPTEGKDIFLGWGIGSTLNTTYRDQGYTLWMGDRSIPWLLSAEAKDILVGWSIGPSLCAYLQKPRIYSLDGGLVHPLA
jgi:hypothetical protein